MPDVVEIILELLDRVFIALPIRIIHLRPAGDPRFHQVPKMIKRNGLLIASGALGTFRAWADQAHVTLEDIPKLRQLIEPQLPQPTPERGDPRHAFPGVTDCVCHLSLHQLCSEFQYVEMLSV